MYEFYAKVLLLKLCKKKWFKKRRKAENFLFKKNKKKLVIIKNNNTFVTYNRRIFNESIAIKIVSFFMYTFKNISKFNAK